MSYKRSANEKYSYNKIILDTKKENIGFKKKYKQKDNVQKRVKKVEKTESVNENILINIDKLINTLELNHNNYNVYDKFYVDMDIIKEKIIIKK